MFKLESLIQHGKINQSHADKIIDNAVDTGNRELLRETLGARTSGKNISHKIFNREHIRKILAEPRLSAVHHFALQADSSHGDDAEEYFAKNASDPGSVKGGLVSAANHPGARAEKIVPHLKNIPEGNQSVLVDIKHTPSSMLNDIAKSEDGWKKHIAISHHKNLNDEVAKTMIHHPISSRAVKQSVLAELSRSTKLGGETLNDVFSADNELSGPDSIYNVRRLTQNPNTLDKTLFRIARKDHSSYTHKLILDHPNVGKLSKDYIANNSENPEIVNLTKNHTV